MTVKTVQGVNFEIPSTIRVRGQRYMDVRSWSFPEPAQKRAKELRKKGWLVVVRKKSKKRFRDKKVFSMWTVYRRRSGKRKKPKPKNSFNF